MSEEPDRGEVTELLIALRAGDRLALDRVWSLLYEELRILARRQRRTGGAALDTTALVHEAYLRLVEADRIEVRDRGHFYALAVRVMRQLLVDLARRQAAKKRGGEAIVISLDDTDLSTENQAHTVLALDDALERLGRLSERWTRVIECRFFGGLSERETAEVLGLPLRTVQRDWQKGRAWLRKELA
ncbi:MAG TPA: ECF-type sigma factor [Thermoanaerobaculia bacterium]|nr:ECF-type sigma factor [Thermoanaerobaculia bacterium]